MYNLYLSNKQRYLIRHTLTSHTLMLSLSNKPHNHTTTFACHTLAINHTASMVFTLNLQPNKRQ